MNKERMEKAKLYAMAQVSPIDTTETDQNDDPNDAVAEKGGTWRTCICTGPTRWHSHKYRCKDGSSGSNCCTQTKSICDNQDQSINDEQMEKAELYGMAQVSSIDTTETDKND